MTQEETERRAMPDTTLYRVFARKVYRRERDTFGRGYYVPNPGARRRTIDLVRGIEAARALCEHGPANKAMAAGLEYRGKPFYEFERE